jgi:hypothetical protein
VHSVVSDRITDRTSFCSIPMRLPEPSGRQSGDLGEKWPLEFCLRTLLVLLLLIIIIICSLNKVVHF